MSLMIHPLLISPLLLGFSKTLSSSNRILQRGMSSSPPTTSLLVVMQQLRDAQERAKKAEARLATLEAENDRLVADLRKAQMDRIASAVGAHASNDEIIIELQAQLSAAVNRNTQLELQMHELNMMKTQTGVHATPSRKQFL